MSLTPFELGLRLVLAVVLGGIVGLEREARSKPAGLRTHMLVALGAACFCLVAFETVRESGDRTGARLAVDPIRLVEGIIGGLGFLGAGAIIRHRGSVEGLTTAGSIWLTGALGVAAGVGQYWLAGFTVALAVVILKTLARIEQRWVRPHLRGEPERDGEQRA